jgi:hypothetical protein
MNTIIVCLYVIPVMICFFAFLYEWYIGAIVDKWDWLIYPFIIVVPIGNIVGVFIIFDIYVVDRIKGLR